MIIVFHQIKPYWASIAIVPYLCTTVGAGKKCHTKKTAEKNVKKDEEHKEKKSKLSLYFFFFFF